MGRKRKFDVRHCKLQNAYVIRKKCPSMGKDDLDRLARLATECYGLKRAIEKFPEEFAPYKDALLAKDARKTHVECKETYSQKMQRFRLERQKGIVSPEAAEFFRRINENSRKRYMANKEAALKAVDECKCAIPEEEAAAVRKNALDFARKWLKKLEDNKSPLSVFTSSDLEYEPCQACGKKDIANHLRAGLCLKCYVKILDAALKERGAARDAEMPQRKRRHENLLIVQ